MFKFNNSHIFTGYIKQLLAEFDLPKYRNGRWTMEDDPNYYWGKAILNKTKNLVIKDNIYDSYTHEYLGEYLRFLKYYHNIDLMSLYNCFSNRICSAATLACGKLDASDTDYKIYMMPIRLGQEYTIALEAGDKVELCCGMYGKYQDKDRKVRGTKPSDKSLDLLTYQCLDTASFDSPIIFKADLSDYPDVKKYVRANEGDLKLFIKMNKTNTTSIAVVEGNYVGYNDVTLSLDANNRLVRQSNRSILNMSGEATLPDINERDFKFISPLQLLQLNTGVCYPFADRLVEYLLDNAITPADEIYDNIRRLQVMVNKNGYTTEYDGVWEPKLRAIIYNYMHQPKYDTFELNRDSLGYADKDVERYYQSVEFIRKPTGEEKIRTTLENVDLYTSIYLDSKVKEGK